MAAKQGKPDPELAFKTAEAFLEVCKVLNEASKNGNTKILIQAMATNAAFVLEMYLKCLLLIEKGNAPHTHDIYDLFHALSDSTQKELTEDHKGFVARRMKTESAMPNLEELLKLGRDAFADFRYAHEQIPSGTDFGLNGLTYCMRERILKLQPNWRPAS